MQYMASTKDTSSHLPRPPPKLPTPCAHKSCKVQSQYPRDTRENIGSGGNKFIQRHCGDDVTPPIFERCCRIQRHQDADYVPWVLAVALLYK